ncbi:CRISPR-associated protein Csx15 [Moorella naiadis]|uniref:CRISPR-associated protein Csx15 n=1 Tax=Moorella naiadis (nom. illeg.) TaxID=3093670 RepID=UPI003D9C82F5
MVLFNLSGHTPPGGSEIYEQIVNITIPNIPVTNEGITNFAKKILKTLPQYTMEKGEFEVILPGMTPLAAVVLAMLHGQYGQFPIIRFAVRQPNGTFKLSEPLDLQEVRLAAREERQKEGAAE